MGWYGDTITYYKHGKCDRKAECDARWNFVSRTGIEVNGKIEMKACISKILASSMTGSTWYGAIEQHITVSDHPELTEKRIFGMVELTRVEGDTFWHKSIDESMGPTECDCPKKILDLLPPPTTEFSANWRRRCEAKRKWKNTLAKLKEGSIIEFPAKYDLTDGTKTGEQIRLLRCHYNGRLKWFKNGRIYNATIPENYTVIKKG
ncbi:MAG: hypothetical protein J6S14_15610 [Clostridia bacterium]|nr:hypothetical protein [Clostridia bacterium]